MNEGLRTDKEYEALIAKAAPIGRWGTAAEVAPAAVFLASSAASFMQGAVVDIDGGWCAQ
jgi:2-deoxy-D-gluconate 3-dehydrogenase